MTNQEHLCGEVEEGKEGVTGVGKRQLGVMSTQFGIQTMYCRAVYLKPV